MPRYKGYIRYQEPRELYRSIWQARGLPKDEYESESTMNLSKHRWICFEKINGYLIGIVIDNGNVTYQGKRESIAVPPRFTDFLDKELEQRKYAIRKIKGKKVVYIEMYGNKIHHGEDYFGNTLNYAVLDVLDVKTGLYMTERELTTFCYSVGMNMVNVIFRGNLDEVEAFVRSRPKSSYSDELTIEGVVARPMGDFLRPDGTRIMLKIECDVLDPPKDKKVYYYEKRSAWKPQKGGFKIEE